MLYIITQPTMLQLLPASLNSACVGGARTQFYSVKCFETSMPADRYVVWIAQDSQAESNIKEQLRSENGTSPTFKVV